MQPQKADGHCEHLHAKDDRYPEHLQGDWPNQRMDHIIRPRQRNWHDEAEQRGHAPGDRQRHCRVKERALGWRVPEEEFAEEGLHCIQKQMRANADHVTA